MKTLFALCLFFLAIRAQAAYPVAYECQGEKSSIALGFLVGVDPTSDKTEITANFTLIALGATTKGTLEGVYHKSDRFAFFPYQEIRLKGKAYVLGVALSEATTTITLFQKGDFRRNHALEEPGMKCRARN